MYYFKHVTQFIAALNLDLVEESEVRVKQKKKKSKPVLTLWTPKSCASYFENVSNGVK